MNQAPSAVYLPRTRGGPVSSGSEEPTDMSDRSALGMSGSSAKSPDKGWARFGTYWKHAMAISGQGQPTVVCAACGTASLCRSPPRTAFRTTQCSACLKIVKETSGPEPCEEDLTV